MLLVGELYVSSLLERIRELSSSVETLTSDATYQVCVTHGNTKQAAEQLA